MITVFLFDSFDKTENIKKLDESLFGLNVEYVQVVDYNDVNNYKKDKWFLLLRKDEYLQDSLTKAIPIYISENTTYKAFSFFKTEDVDKFSLCPRLFHPSVLIDDQWRPININRTEIINALDGWVYRSCL